MSISSNTLELGSGINFRHSSDDIVELLNYIDKLFFKGDFDHLSYIWSKVITSECHNPYIRAYYWFLRIREALYFQDIQDVLILLHKYTLEYKKDSTLTQEVDISKIFDLELINKNSLNEEFLDFFCEQAMQIALQKEYPLESRVHYLFIGSSTLLDFGTNIFNALQYSQLAVSLAEQLPDEKRFYLAWALACEAQVFWKIGNIEDALLNANSSLELFIQHDTGEFLGRFIAIKVLIFLAVAQGRFDYAITLIHLIRATSIKTHILESYFLEFDLYIARGSLDSAHKVIDEIIHLDISNYTIKWDPRFLLRELHLMMLEGFPSLVDRQIQALLKQSYLDNESKIHCYMLLADNFAYMHEFDQALSNAYLALELARKKFTPDRILDIYRLMIDLGLRRSIESENEYETINNDQWKLDIWFDEAYSIALERNANITLIELQLYAILRQILKNELNSSLKPLILEIQKQCADIKWIRGERLVEKLSLFIDSSTLAQTIITDQNTSKDKSVNISLEEVKMYLKDLKTSI